MPSAGSIKLPSPAPATVPVTQGTGGAGSRSRLSQQVHTATTGRGRRTATSVGPDADEDAEGEEDVEEEAMEESGDADDQALYCICQKMSYGEMIACDDPACPYQWVRPHDPLISERKLTFVISFSSTFPASASNLRSPRSGIVRTASTSTGRSPLVDRNGAKGARSSRPTSLLLPTRTHFLSTDAHYLLYTL